MQVLDAHQAAVVRSICELLVPVGAHLDTGEHGYLERRQKSATAGSPA